MNKYQEALKRISKHDYQNNFVHDFEFLQELIDNSQQPTQYIPFNEYAKVECIRGNENYTEGKVYVVKNGKIKGDITKCLGTYNSLEELNKGLVSDFKLVSQPQEPVKTLEELGYELTYKDEKSFVYEYCLEEDEDNYTLLRFEKDTYKIHDYHEYGDGVTIANIGLELHQAIVFMLQAIINMMDNSND